MLSLDLPKWFDLHTHFRQGPGMGAYIRSHRAMGCAGVLAMPNTKPPVARVFGSASEQSWSIEQYTADLIGAGADCFESLIVPLYLTGETTPAMIEEGASRGILKACKYYPPHGTTNSEHGVPMDGLIGGSVFRKMEETGTILCVHGEQHGLAGEDYLGARSSAESSFYTEMMPRLLEAHPELRIVCEHVTSKEAVDFVENAGSRVGATVTPQHLLFTLGHLIQGLKYHLYCLPIVKFEEDRAALRRAVTKPGQAQFFAGTDSAPHTTKATECGCAAGCFVGGCAPQLYAMAFEEAGVDFESEAGVASFERFLCSNGPGFYSLQGSTERFVIEKAPGDIEALETDAGRVVPLPLGMGLSLTWRLA